MGPPTFTKSQQTRNIDPVLVQCWSNVADIEPIKPPINKNHRPSRPMMCLRFWSAAYVEIDWLSTGINQRLETQLNSETPQLS